MFSYTPNAGIGRKGSITIGSQLQHLIQQGLQVGYEVSYSTTTSADGTVSCTSPVSSGGNSVCAITPDPGFAVDSVVDNAVEVASQLSGNTYTIKNTTADHALTVKFKDVGMPSVTAFTLPSATSFLTVPVNSFTAADNVAVTGYMVTGNPTSPSASAVGWSATPPTTFTFTSPNALTAYAWVKDAAGNISASRSAAVDINSSDGTVWAVTTAQTPTTNHLWSVAYGGGIYVAAGEHNTILTSTDGSIWASSSSPLDGPYNSDTYLRSVAYGNGKFVVAGEYYSMSSTDGVSWLIGSSDSQWAVMRSDVAFGNGRFIMVGDAFGKFSSIDGENWTRQGQPFHDPALTTANFINGIFVVTGIRLGGFPTEKKIGVMLMTSADGLAWVWKDPPTPDEIHRIAYGNGIMVAVGAEGNVMVGTKGHVWTSTDNAVSWNLQNPGTDQILWGIAYGGGVFMAVGNDGTILISPDGINWSGVATHITGSWLGVTYADGKFTAVGMNGKTVQISPVKRTCGIPLLAADGQSLPYTSGTDSIAVSATEGCSWTASTTEPWITIMSGSNGTGSDTVNYSVAANSGDARTGTLTIAGQTFTVTQDARQYVVTSSAVGTGGSLSCTSPVAHGSNSTCTVTPSSGFSLATLSDNTANVLSLVSETTYTISNVTTDHSVSATFAFADNSTPIVTTFTIPVTGTSLTVPISTLTATDNVAVVGYLVTESAIAPSASSAGWGATVPASYSVTGTVPQGVATVTTLFAWAKDAAGNVSLSQSASVTTTLPDRVQKAGDCDSDGIVTIAEVQSAINMFLGLNTVAACVDLDNSGTVSIAEVQKAINAFLGM